MSANAANPFIASWSLGDVDPTIPGASTLNRTRDINGYRPLHQWSFNTTRSMLQELRWDSTSIPIDANHSLINFSPSTTKFISQRLSAITSLKISQLTQTEVHNPIDCNLCQRVGHRKYLSETLVTL
ncbi:Hypothetical protein CINCED_3A021870 [Cinara cedri]|uniref:Uncharacterized protein n=1 Tax=Cinara cedri TaxID=506608 RepID=A0A5E4NJQ6_9HEMI|nr:Hypothetical protein CINCED_3A021870 [Cinara cedri]